MPYDLLDAYMTYLNAQHDALENDTADPYAEINALLASAEHADYMSIRGEVLASVS